MSVPGYRITGLESPSGGKHPEVRCDIIGGGIPAPSDARLFPGGRRVRVKSVVRSGEFYRIGLKGAARSDLVPGAVVLDSRWPVVECTEALLLPDGGPLPDETEAVRGGPCPDFNRERLIGRGRFRMSGSFVSLTLPAPYPLFAGARVSILDSGSVSRLFTVLFPGTPPQDVLRRLNAMAPRRPEPHPPESEIAGRILHAAGFVELPPPLLQQSWPRASAAGSWLILDERRSVLERRVLKLSARPGGADRSLMKIDGIPDDLLYSLSSDMAGDGRLVRRGDWFFPPGPPPLAPFHRSWLRKVEDSGINGIRCTSVSEGADQSALEVLSRSGLILGGAEMWLVPGAVEELKRILMDGTSPGDTLSMADARQRLGGSRVRTLELLGILEKNGILRRDGEERIVT